MMRFLPPGNFRRRGVCSLRPAPIGVIASSRFAGEGGGGPPTDPYFANVILLLHMNGVDGSTTFTDVKGKIWTPSNAQIDTAQSLYGGASGLFTGASNSYIDTPDHADFAVGTSDFTFEYAIRFAAIAAATQQIGGQSASTGAATSQCVTTQLTSTGKIQCYGCSGGSVVGACPTTTSPVINTWYRVAYVRSGSSFSLYLNGTREATASSASSLNNSTTKFALGRLGELVNAGLNGWLDEVRFTVGVARYTGASYTLATEQFPDQ